MTTTNKNTQNKKNLRKEAKNRFIISDYEMNERIANNICDIIENEDVQAWKKGWRLPKQFKDKDLQSKLFKYSGKEAVVLQKASDYNWKETGIVYWQGNPIKRDSKEYDDLIDELYISAIQNEFYRNAIKNCNLSIIHAMGEIDKKDTVFTRYEFEYMLNCLHDFLNK